MTTHARSPLGVVVCGSRSRLFAFFACEITCKRCKETTRRLRAAQQKGVCLDPSGPEVVTRASSSSTGSVVAFGHAAASTIPGTCIRKWPHQHAFRFIHTLPNSRIVITKYASPTMPEWT